MIAMTASTTAAERERILAAGFDDVWTKPISLADLVENVSAYLESDDPADASPPVLPSPLAAPTGRNHAMNFLETMPERMKAITSAIREHDGHRCRELLHQLVGSAGIHGFDEISHHATRLMAECGDGQPPDETAASALLSACESVLRQQNPDPLQER